MSLRKMSKSAIDNTLAKRAGTQSPSFLAGIVAGDERDLPNIETQQFRSFASSIILGGGGHVFAFSFSLSLPLSDFLLH